MELGQEVFCTDAKTKKIFEAEVTGFAISGGVEGSRGYKLIKVLNSKGKETVTEVAHIHKSKALAEKFIKEVGPYIDESQKLMEDTKKKLDELRIKVIGSPEYASLAERVENHGS